MCECPICGGTKWKDVGSCDEGCCDKYECENCGHQELEEVAD